MQRLFSLVQSSALFISHLGKSGLKNDTDPLMQREKGELPCLVYGTDAGVSLRESKSCWHVKVYLFFLFLRQQSRLNWFGWGSIIGRFQIWKVSFIKKKKVIKCPYIAWKPIKEIPGWNLGRNIPSQHHHRLNPLLQGGDRWGEPSLHIFWINNWFHRGTPSSICTAC